MIWHEFERIFINKHLHERYYNRKVDDFYELKMGSMTDKEYTNKFIKFLRYVPYLRDEKEKIQRFINGLLVA